MNPQLQANFHHLAIAVQDMDRVLSFYCDLLGFNIDWEIGHYTGEKFDKVVALENAESRVVMLSGYGTHLELFQYYCPEGKNAGRKRMCDFGYTHFALQVSDLAPLYERLESAGVEFHCPPQSLRPGVNATYLRDPEGNAIELIQYQQA